MTALGKPLAARATGTSPVPSARPRPSRAAWVVWGLVALFLGINFWWLWTDSRAPGIDSGFHLGLALQYRSQLQAGDLLGPFQNSANYPPIIHIVGALGSLVGGLSSRAMVAGLNVVFLPLLAFGTYHVGRIAHGARAGVLAALFALGTPIVLSGFHEFLLDVPETAMVAAAAALLLASDRFARTGHVVAAGVVVGIGLLTKQSFALFLAGLVAVMILRGGWRRWRNVAIFCGLALALALPWYLSHRAQIQSTAHSLSQPAIFWYGHVPYPERWTLTNFAWYGWSLVNVQLFLPLMLLFVAGTVVAVRRFWRDRSPADITPELVCAGLVGYLGETYFRLHDPRYTTPALVFIAVLGTGWLARARTSRRRAAGAGLLIAILALNTAVVTFGALDRTVVLRPFGGPPSPIRERQLVVIGPNQYDGLSGPSSSDRIFEIIKAAKRQGAKLVAFYTAEGDVATFNGNGMFALLNMAGMLNTPQDDPAFLGPRDIYLFRDAGPIDRRLPPPCTQLADGSELYVLRGVKTLKALRRYPRSRFECPLRP